MADALHRRWPGTARERLDGLIASVAIADSHAHLDEFLIAEGPIQLATTPSVRPALPT